MSSAIESAKIHLSDEIYLLQGQLLKNIRHFDSLIKDSVIESKVINFNSISPVRGIRIGDEFKDIEITCQLRSRGIAVLAAMYPTVAEGESMLRIAFSANHSEADIRYLCECLFELMS